MIAHPSTSVLLLDSSILVYIEDGKISGGVLFARAENENRTLRDLIARARGILSERLFGKQEELFPDATKT